MAKGKRICKVCGAEYEYCHTIRKTGNVFRYQDVACCPEHGKIYFDRILASRAKKNEVPVEQPKEKHEDVSAEQEEKIVDVPQEDSSEDSKEVDQNVQDNVPNEIPEEVHGPVREKVPEVPKKKAQKSRKSATTKQKNK